MKRKLNVYFVVLVLYALVTVSLPSTVFGAEEPELSPSDKLEIILQIADKVRSSYVDTSLSITEFMDGAIEGLVDKLDPHSSYMPYEEASDFNEKIRGNFQGIGIQFAMINDKITVIQVIDNGPSETVGLRSRDKIVKINGEDVVGIKQDTVRDLLRGEKGSTVNVHVERPGESDLLEFTITRDRVNTSSVAQAFMLSDDTGYIKISKFTILTHFEVNKALRMLKDRGMERLVLDLRSNSGGALDAARGVVDNFIDRKHELIVETKGKTDNQKMWTTGEGEHGDMPIIVMINHSSASASEIVAGALQDHDRALIVGQTSFGKGLVMHEFRLRKRGKNFGSLVLSVAHYYTPSGRLIQRSYENGKDQYIREGFDDFDPNAVDSTRAGKPVFYTDLGREVFGGGGITPDRMLQPLKRLNSLERRLRSTNLFFEFADGYLTMHDDVPEDFETFNERYDIPDDEVRNFRNFIDEKGIRIDNSTPFREELKKLITKYDLPNETVDIVERTLTDNEVNMAETLFAKSVDFIKREIKGEIARMIWGDEERFKVWQLDDTELFGALSYSEEARDMLDKRLALGQEVDGQTP